MKSDQTETVRSVLQLFQDGYIARDVDQLDAFMELFDPGEVELIGIGAMERAGEEWFVGIDAVRDIIAGDWTYWGDVKIDVTGAEIRVLGQTAWFSTTGAVAQTAQFETSLPFFIEKMTTILNDEVQDNQTRLLEATHFGLRRYRESQIEIGHPWPFTLTGVLTQLDDAWRFRLLHFAMPVD